MDAASKVAASALCFFLVAAGGALGQGDSAAASKHTAEQTPESTPHSLPAAPQTAAMFALNETGIWDLSGWAREEFGNSAYGTIGDALVSIAGFRAGYVFVGPAGEGRLRGTLEYFFDLIPVFVLTKPQVTYGGGISPVGLKWNFVRGRWQPSLETSLGGILSTRDVPTGNTSNLNFTVSAAGSAAIFTHGRHALTANVGFWHFSNAHIGRNNPSLNALQVGIEYHTLLSKKKPSP